MNNKTPIEVVGIITSTICPAIEYAVREMLEIPLYIAGR